MSVPAASSSAISFSSVMGYFWKSLGSLNWVGLTKMLQTVLFARAFDKVISEIWPACNAPIVGTKPMDLPVAVSAFNQFDRSADCLKMIIFWVLSFRSG